MKPDIYKSIYSDKNRDVFLNYLKNNISPNSNILEIGPVPGLSTNLIIITGILLCISPLLAFI